MDNYSTHKLHSDIVRTQKIMALKTKMEQIRKNLDETRRYELLTTNQYLDQMEIILDVLQDLSIPILQKKEK